MKFSMRMSAGNFTKRCSIIFVAVLLPLYVQAQFIVAPGTEISNVNGTQITIQSSGTVSNGSGNNLESSDLSLSLIEDPRVIKDPEIIGGIIVDILSFNTSRNVTLNGSLIVTSQINFTEGIIKVPSSSLFLYTGPDENISTTANISFVDGIFYQTGGGKRIFPVGLDRTYTPVIFPDMRTNESDTIGIQVLTGPSQIQVSDFEDGSVALVANDHHWRILTGRTTSVSKINSQVALGLGGLSVDLTESTPLVLQRSEDGISQNLRYLATSATGFVQSIEPVTANTMAVGTSDEVIVTIYQVITPFGSQGKNDILTVRHIEAYDFIKVKLLDRYGVLIKEWGNEFPTEVRNFDFTQLSPGNYICIAQYGKEENAMKEQSQMITVLRSK